eukprot:scaffold239700_cov23-Tisochrysis_lutea.AAC.1
MIPSGGGSWGSMCPAAGRRARAYGATAPARPLGPARAATPYQPAGARIKPFKRACPIIHLRPILPVPSPPARASAGRPPRTLRHPLFYPSIAACHFAGRPACQVPSLQQFPTWPL